MEYNNNTVETPKDMGSKHKPFNLDIDVINTKHRQENNTTYCDMAFKLNLNEFENNYFTFSESFIKNKISEFLPIIKTIYNYSYSDFNPIVAKFYILPTGTAKVLVFDSQYYKKYRKFDNEHLLSVGQIIPAKKVLNAVNKYGEINEYNYCSTFKTTGKAVCMANDQYNQLFGEALSQQKAMLKASIRINKLFKVISNKAEQMYKTLETAISATDSYNIRLTEMIAKSSDNETNETDSQ